MADIKVMYELEDLDWIGEEIGLLKLVLICNDMLKVIKKLPDNSFDLVILDPPYNITKSKKIFIHPREYIKEIDRITKENSTIWFFCVYNDCDLIATFKKYFEVRDLLIWYKPNKFGMLPKSYPNDVELIFRFTKGDPVFNTKYRQPKQIREIPLKYKEFRELKKIGVEITPKPLEIIEELVRVSTRRGDWVLDPFAGTGVTMKACLKHVRHCVCIEIEEKLVSYIIKHIL